MYKTPLPDGGMQHNDVLFTKEIACTAAPSQKCHMYRVLICLSYARMSTASLTLGRSASTPLQAHNWLHVDEAWQNLMYGCASSPGASFIIRVRRTTDHLLSERPPPPSGLDQCPKSYTTAVLGGTSIANHPVSL